MLKHKVPHSIYEDGSPIELARFGHPEFPPLFMVYDWEGRGEKEKSNNWVLEIYLPGMNDKIYRNWDCPEDIIKQAEIMGNLMDAELYIEDWEVSKIITEQCRGNLNQRWIELGKNIIPFLMKMSEQIDESDTWWLDCPARGGFDKGKIDKFITEASAIAEAEKGGTA